MNALRTMAKVTEGCSAARLGGFHDSKLRGLHETPGVLRERPSLGPWTPTGCQQRSALHGRVVGKQRDDLPTVQHSR
jgi:hypothetical protein